MKHIILSLVIVAAAIAFPACAADTTRPNIVLILADDLGYETIGAYGGTSYRTPVVDKLAASGVRFDRCFVQPLCTPTRTQLMTGLYNIRNYVDFGHMDPHAITFGNAFQKAGYVTCMAGKWQLGRDANLPKAFGFDEYCLWQHLRRPPRYANPGLEVNGQAKDFNNGEYGPDVVSDYVLDFIRRRKNGPFFLYYPMVLTHAPYQPTPDSKDWDPKAIGEGVHHKPEHFKDMVEYMDKLIGKVIATLDETGIRERTLVIFLGDNGTGAGVRSMMGDKLVIGAKGKMTDAGMHVPLVLNWPGHINGGRACSDLVDSTDFLPTMCDAAKVAIPPEMKLDGRTFFPQAMGEKGSPRDWYYSWYGPWGAFVGEFAANEKFKLYRDGRFYDLARDIDEKQALQVSALTGDAAMAAKVLQAGLDQYKDARPAAVAEAAAKAAKTGRKAGE